SDNSNELSNCPLARRSRFRCPHRPRRLKGLPRCSRLLSCRIELVLGGLLVLNGLQPCVIGTSSREHSFCPLRGRCGRLLSGLQSGLCRLCFIKECLCQRVLAERGRDGWGHWDRYREGCDDSCDQDRTASHSTNTCCSDVGETAKHAHALE